MPIGKEMSFEAETQPLSLDTRRRARAALTLAYDEARRMPGNLLPPECVGELFGAAQAIVDEVGARPVVAPLPAPAPDRAEQTIDATVVGVAVGTQVLDGSDELTDLGTGLLVKDIGELALPPRLVEKPDQLAPDEAELLQHHPLLGLEFVRGHQPGPGACSVVRSHHERWDGSGYPDLLTGEQIPPYARIAAVADAFTGPSGIDAVRAGAGSAFDPELSAVLDDLLDARRLKAA